MSAEDRRLSILEAARQAFVSSGYGGARTRDIAERAGVNEALLFRHFATKEQIFHEAVVEPLIAVMGTSMTPTDDLDDATAVIEIKRTNTQATMRQMLEVMQSAMPLLGVALFADNERATALYREQITPILDAGAARLHKRYGTWDHRPFDADLMPRITMGMCLFVVMDAYFTGRTLDLDATATELAALITFGTVPRPGEIA